MSKTLKILKQAIIDYIEFIYFLSKITKMCKNYNVDSNSSIQIRKEFNLNPWFTLNYNRVWFKTLN